LLENNKVTGAVNVELSEDGIPTYTFVEYTAYDNIPFSEDLESVAKELDMVCFGTLAQRGSVSHETIMRVLSTLKEGAIKVFDVNLRREYY